MARTREAARLRAGRRIAVGGWPGGIEPATAVCRLDADGKLTVVLGSVDLTGTNTAFAQIAAETFGMPADEIQVKRPRPTPRRSRAAPAAPRSRTRWVWPCSARPRTRGGRSGVAARHSKRRSTTSRSPTAWCGPGRPGVRHLAQGDRRPHDGIRPQVTSRLRHRARRPSRERAGFAAHLVEVEIDEVTGETRPVRYVAVQDVGFAINPAEVEAQIHGGVAQGIGWALYEGWSTTTTASC